MPFGKLGLGLGVSRQTIAVARGSKGAFSSAFSSAFSK
jgi:hypothetical protein